MTYHPRPETREKLERRDESIREQFALGVSRQDLAEEYDLTIPRIMQIVTYYRKRP